jgi:hypothetical protein
MASLDHILTTERDTRRFRLLSLVVVAATLYFRQEDVALVGASVGLAFFFAYNLLLGPILPRFVSRIRPRGIPYLIYAMAAVDGVAVTILVHFTGGITSITVILIPLFVMYHTIYLGRRSGIVSASFFSILYLIAARIENELAGNTGVLVGQVGLFFLLAVFSGYLTRRVLVEAQERDLLQDLILDAGAANGVHVEDMTIQGNMASFTGRALNEAAMEQFLARLQAMRRLSSVRLDRLPAPKGPGATPEGAMAFSVAARVR